MSAVPEPLPAHEDVPAGLVKVPLDRPARRVVALVAQLSPLVSTDRGRERVWCTATGGKLAEYLSVGRPHVQAELAAAEKAGLLAVEKYGQRGRRRRLADPHPFRFAIVSKRAIGGVGCHWIDGKWVARRNAEFLFALYCELAHDERTGVRSSQEDLAGRLGVSEQDVKRGLRTLRADGWITAQRTGKGNVYRVHDAALVPVPGEREQAPQEVIHREEPGVSTATRQGSVRRHVRGQYGDTDIEPDVEPDVDSPARPVRGARVGDARACATAPSASVQEKSGKASAAAREVLGKLPSPMRQGADRWVRRLMARRIDRILADGHRPGAIVGTAERLHLAADDHNHLPLLDRLHAALKADAMTGEICPECGDDRYAAGGRCMSGCDADAPMSERELEQAARIRAQFGVTA